MKAGTWSLMAVLLVAAGAWGQSLPASLDSLDAMITQTMQEWQVPGLALAVIQNGAVVYSKGYGVRDLAAKDSVTTKTLFSIASSTKAFTATLAAMLVQDSLIAWDTPLKTYFPDFALYDPAATDKVTLRDLLCHRTGIPEQEFFRMNEPATRVEVMRRARYFEPNHDFRSVWTYNNLGYTVAGTMLGLRAGTEWEALVRSRIFEPLAMRHSVFSVEAMQQAADYACPHIVYGTQPERMEFYDADLLGPAGCIVSNVEDLSQWVLFHLNRGEAQGKALVKPEILAETRKPQIPLPPRGGKEILCPSYGMGWMIDAYRGSLHVHHGGLLFGFTALVSMLPQEGIGLVVLTNLNNTPLPGIVEGYVYDRLLKLPPVDWNQRRHDAWAKLDALIKEAEATEDPDRKPDVPLSHPLLAYAGLYRSDGYGDIAIRQDGDTLRAKLTTGECPLYRYHGDTLELYHNVKRAGWQIVFHSDAAGRVEAFSVTLAPDVKAVHFTRVDDPAAN